MKIGMLFPGYGSQYVGMGKELYDTSRTVQEYFEEASNCLNENFVKLCFASSDAELGKMSNAYPALFLVSVSIFALLKEKGIMPDIVASYNLGEYSALCATGGLSFPDGLYLLNKFAHFYQEACSSMEVAVAQVTGVPLHVLKEVFAAIPNAESLTVAFYHSPTDHIITGYRSAIEAFEERICSYENAKIKSLSPAVGLHSSLMNQVAGQFSTYLSKVDFHNLNVPLINCVDAQEVTMGQEVKNGIIAQITRPIVWERILNQISSCDLLIEIGPGTFLSELAKKQYPDKQIISVQKQVDIDKLSKIVERSDNRNPEL